MSRQRVARARFLCGFSLCLATLSASAQDRPPVVFNPDDLLAKTPPMILVVDSMDGVKWACAKTNLQSQCGDLDGCKVTFMLQHKVDPNDMVRGIVEHIYMEHPGLSNHRGRGVNGYTRQEGGGELGWITGNGTPYTIANPWGWIHMLNYDHTYCGGNQKAYADPYEFSFLTHPHVRSLVIVED